MSKDTRGWVALADENILTEFQLAPEGSSRRLEWRDELCKYIKDLTAITCFTRPETAA